MGLPRKDDRPSLLGADLSLPGSPPSLQADTKTRFPTLAAWEQSFASWWDSVRRALVAVDDSFRAASALLRENKTLAQNAQSEADSLVGRVSTLETTCGGSSDLAAQVQAISAQLAALLANFAQHIAAITAHGVTGVIVGTTDAQSLDNKTIGFTAPGYGRFTTVMGCNTIPLGANITIPAGYYMVVGGSLTIDGTLTIEGVLVVV